jgi:hypothetical protein
VTPVDEIGGPGRARVVVDQDAGWVGPGEALRILGHHPEMELDDLGMPFFDRSSEAFCKEARATVGRPGR